MEFPVPPSSRIASGLRVMDQGVRQEMFALRSGISWPLDLGLQEGGGFFVFSRLREQLYVNRKEREDRQDMSANLTSIPSFI